MLSIVPDYDKIKNYKHYCQKKDKQEDSIKDMADLLQWGQERSLQVHLERQLGGGEVTPEMIASSKATKKDLERAVKESTSRKARTDTACQDADTVPEGGALASDDESIDPLEEGGEGTKEGDGTEQDGGVAQASSGATEEDPELAVLLEKLLGGAAELTTDQTGKAKLTLSWDKELVMLPEGVLEFGIVLSSVRIIHVNMKSAMDLEEQGGLVLKDQPLNGICFEADGKRKVLLNGWILYTAGGTMCIAFFFA